MPVRITREVAQSHSNCKLKAHLQLAGEAGQKGDFELLLADAREVVRRQAIAQIVARHGEDAVVRGPALSEATLRQGAAFVLDAVLEEDDLAFRFDGLKRVAGNSRLGDFHYAPVLFHAGRAL